MALRWGVAGSGKISQDFVNALKGLPAQDHQIVAVAARSMDSAQKFAQKHNINKAYDGYIGLAQDKTIEVVYIGVLNPQHYGVMKMMLENGKNVICEKPFAMNEKQASEIIQLAKQKGLFLMEAVWSRCFPVYQELRKLIDSGEIGDVYQVSVEFGFPIQKVDRIKSKEMGGGAILDLGIYILQFQQFVFRGLTPTKVSATGHLNSEGVDQSAAAIITYPEGKTAVVSCSTMVELPNEGIISGSKGQIRIPNFWNPTEMSVNGKVSKFPLPVNNAEFNYQRSAGLAYEAEEVRKCIKSGKLESPSIPLTETLQLAKLMDSLRKQVGVVFDCDA